MCSLCSNKLSALPSWVGDCFFLVKLDVSHNCLTSLPDKYVVSCHLRVSEILFIFVSRFGREAMLVQHKQQTFVDFSKLQNWEHA